MISDYFSLIKRKFSIMSGLDFDKLNISYYNKDAIKSGEVIVGLRVNSYRLDPLNLSDNAVVGIIFVNKTVSKIKYDTVFLL